MNKKNEQEKPIRCIVYLSTDGTSKDVSVREGRQLRYITQYAKSHNIEICKIYHRNIMGQLVVNQHFDAMVEMVRQGFADGILIANMQRIAVDVEDACRKIGKISKANGAIYSVDDGKLCFSFSHMP